MRNSPIAGLVLLTACASTTTIPSTQSTTRKVTFQPPNLSIPRPTDGKPGDFKTTVGLVIGSNGLVSSVIPMEGQEPFLSETMRYAKEWRFSKNLPTSSEAPQILSVTYHWGSARSAQIDLKH